MSAPDNTSTELSERKWGIGKMYNLFNPNHQLTGGNEGKKESGNKKNNSKHYS
jgi:hypothetical protein